MVLWPSRTLPIQPFYDFIVLQPSRTLSTPPLCDHMVPWPSRTPKTNCAAIPPFSNLPRPPPTPPSRDPTFLSPSRTPQTPPAPPPPGAPGPEDPTWRRAMAAGMQRPPPTPRTPHPRSRRHHAVPRALTEHEHGARAHHGGGDGCKRERGAAAERSGAASHGPHFAPPPQRLAPPTGPPGPIRGRAVGRAANRKRSELSGSGEGR